MNAKRRAAGATTALVGAAALALSGCSSAEPGAAAIVGETIISQQAVGEQLAEINELLQRPADAPSAQAAGGIVSVNVEIELVDQVGEQQGVSIPPAEVDRRYAQEVERAGGANEINALAAQSFIAPDQFRQFLTTQLTFEQMSRQAVPDGNAEQQTQAGLALLITGAQEIGVEVAPKYGVWSYERLGIVDDPNPVSQPPHDETEGLTTLPAPGH